jgi:hypothetical protein
LGSYGHTVQADKDRTRPFEKVKFVYEKRKENVDAHNLVRSSIYLPLGRHVWLQYPSDGVYERYVYNNK